MRYAILGLLCLLAAPSTNAAPTHHHGAGRKPSAAKCEMCAKCPMCQEMMAGGKMGGMGGGKMGGMGGGMGGMMGGKGGMDGGMMGGMRGPAAPTVTVAADGSVLVLRGNTLLKYNSELKLVNQTDLPGAGGHDHH